MQYHTLNQNVHKFFNKIDVPLQLIKTPRYSAPTQLLVVHNSELLYKLRKSENKSFFPGFQKSQSAPRKKLASFLLPVDLSAR